MAITLEQAKALYIGQELYHVQFRNSDGTPVRWRVNGQVKTWKTRPDEVRVPIKHGLYAYDYLTHNDLDLVCLTEEEALGPDRFHVNVVRFSKQTRVTVRDILSGQTWVKRFENAKLDNLPYPLTLDVKPHNDGYCLHWGYGCIALYNGAKDVREAILEECERQNDLRGGD